MNNANKIAKHLAPIDRNDFRALKNVFVTVVASIVLAACGGGAETVENQQVGGTGPVNKDAPYSGPVARDGDVLRFQQEFWSNVRTADRCGNCHNETVARSPMFARSDDVNMAYDTAVGLIDVNQPSASAIVAKVYSDGNGHNCWVADASVCQTIVTTWIENWLGGAGGGGRSIILTPPVSQDPGASKNFPPDATTTGSNGTSFANTVYPVLTANCSGCHSSEAGTPIQPYFADPNVDGAYEAAKSKMNLDTPAFSRFVERLSNEFHNCWTNSCTNDGQEMLAAITAFANGIALTQVDPNLTTSKAMRLTDGTLASGGNRFEDAQVALWEFKTGSGTVAFDTSGVDPAIDLNLSSEVTWFGGWGITTNGGRAQATTTSSRKLYDVLQESGEFSIEAWVVPANVTQEMARIVSYSANSTSRNFALQQTLYNYDFLLRTNAADGQGNPLTNLNGDPALSTPDADEVLQATLQHVVATYHPIDGRRIYVNGELRSATDPIPGGTFVDWQDTFAVVIGSEVGGDDTFMGTVRLAAVHRRALTPEQVTQNFDVGVGEKFFLLFNVSEILYPGDATMADSSYILFEVAQYDTYAYLFDKPHFVTLDGSSPEGIPIEGVRIAMNGIELPVGQTYAKMDDTLSAALFQELGQPLSTLGAVLPLEKGPADDEFFLTFDRLAASSFNRPDDPMLIIVESDLVAASKIGIKTFDEIDATYSAVTGVDRMQFANVDMTFQELRQSLPAVESIDTFLSSHQVAIAQLAIAYCDAMIGTNASPNPSAATKFPGFNFGAAPGTAFSVGNRGVYVNKLVNDIMGTGIATQPAFAEVYGELAANTPSGGRPANLIDRLLNPPPGATPSDTRAISKGVCATMLGSAATLIQ
jgi:hypothetical protein